MELIDVIEENINFNDDGDVSYELVYQENQENLIKKKETVSQNRATRRRSRSKSTCLYTKILFFIHLPIF